MTDAERLAVRRQAFAEAVQVVKDHRAQWAVNPVGAGAAKVLDNVMAIERALTRLQEEAASCRFACSAFPMCGCEVEALSPPNT